MPADRAPLTTLNDIVFLVAHRDASEVLRSKRDGVWHTLPGHEVYRQIVKLALSLVRLGIHAGDRVALLSENRPEWAISDFAILATGAANVPLYPTLTAESCAYILRHSEARGIIVSSREHLDRICRVWTELPNLEFAILASGEAPASSAGRVLAWSEVCGEGEPNPGEQQCFRNMAHAVRASDLASIVYTSGTTGTPKGVMLSHANLVSNLLTVPSELHPGDLALSFLPLSHVYERIVDYHYLHRGVVVAYAESIEAVAQNMLEVRPTVAAAVPRFFEKLYAKVLEKLNRASPPRRKLFWWAMSVGHECTRRQLSGQTIGGTLRARRRLADWLVFARLRDRLGGRIRFFLSGSAPLSPNLAGFFHAAGIPICEGYGLTETSPVVSGSHIGEVRPGTVGRPLPGVDVRIAPDGEVLVRGPNVMMGYYKDPEETARVLVDGWLHTGDIGELTPEGYLRITDRKKDLIKTAGGKFVAPQPIENMLRQSPYIMNAVVLGDRRPFVVALIVPDSGRLAEALRARGIEFGATDELLNSREINDLLQEQINNVNSRLAQFEQIKRFVLLDRDFSIDAGTLTPTLKVRRSLVEKRYRDLLESLYRAA